MSVVRIIFVVISWSLVVVALPSKAELNVNQATVGLANWALFDEADRTAVHTSISLKPMSSLYNLQPVALAVWADEGQRYFAVGVSKTFATWDKLSFGGAFHAGFIDQPDRLGHKVEYYSTLQLEYQWTPKVAVRTELGHISNAGFGSVNPGSESFVISLVYSL